MGGLGVLDLQKMNEALLAKWIWRLENSSGLWQTIINHKYVKKRPIISVRKKQNDSHLISRKVSSQFVTNFINIVKKYWQW
jgi:hypothetical protein